MLKIAAVSAWSAGHILSIFVRESMSISAIGQTINVITVTVASGPNNALWGTCQNRFPLYQ